MNLKESLWMISKSINHTVRKKNQLTHMKNINIIIIPTLQHELLQRTDTIGINIVLQRIHNLSWIYAVNIHMQH